MDSLQVLNSITATIALLVALLVALLSTQYDLRAGSHGIQGGENRISGATGGWIAFLDVCTRRCDGSKANSSRIFWTLYNGIVRLFQVASRREQHDAYFPISLSDPSSLTVFAGWLIVALMISITSEVSGGSRLHSYFLLCGVLVAIILGVLECATLSSILLTNVPWCVVFGLMFCAVLPGRKKIFEHPRDRKDSREYPSLIEEIAGTK